MRESIRATLLRWLMPLLGVLLVVSAAMSLYTARVAATLAYDQSLYAAAADVASTVQQQDGRLVLDLSAQSEQIMRTDELDTLYFSVHTANGEFIGGDIGLPRLSITTANRHVSTPGRVGGQAVHLLAARFERGGQAFIVTVAETNRKRDAMFLSIVATLLVPELLLLMVALAAVWLAVRRGLVPLRRLEHAIASRNSKDLAPIDIQHIPREVEGMGHALNGLLDRLRLASQRQHQFIADAAHQLRTPLAGIQAQTELLAHMPASELPGQIESLSQSVRRAVRLANQLLVLARAEPSAAAALAPCALDLACVVKDSADDWYHRALARRIDLGFELLPAPVQADPFLTCELLANLLDNALIYTPEGGTVTVYTGSSASGSYLRVDDSGPGIPPHERERILERFQRGDHAEAPSGSGLGLAIVKEIAEAHNARIAIDSTETGGTRVDVLYPAVVPSSAAR